MSRTALKHRLKIQNTALFEGSTIIIHKTGDGSNKQANSPNKNKAQDTGKQVNTGNQAESQSQKHG